MSVLTLIFFTFMSHFGFIFSEPGLRESEFGEGTRGTRNDHVQEIKKNLPSHISSRQNGGFSLNGPVFATLSELLYKK